MSGRRIEEARKQGGEEARRREGKEAKGVRRQGGKEAKGERVRGARRRGEKASGSVSSRVNKYISDLVSLCVSE